jgi:hypothetical protein
MILGVFQFLYMKVEGSFVPLAGKGSTTFTISFLGYPVFHDFGSFSIFVHENGGKNEILVVTVDEMNGASALRASS